MDKRKVILGGVVAMVLAVGAWAFGLIGGTDREVSELQSLSEQMRDPNLTEAQRDQFRAEFRIRVSALSEEQREAYFDSNRDQWRGRMEQRMNEYFAMSPAAQQQRLDEMIDRMLVPRPPRTQTTSTSGRGEGPSRGNRASMTEAQRDERAKRRLDRTSATQRAQFSEFRRQLDQRAKERGIQELPGFPGRGRGV